ncbi:MAG: branched-chain amino acid ABC transporter permease [Candidatus Dormibacteria bacterium]
MVGFGHALGFGLVTAALVALSSVALSLQYSVTNIVNFAHGELLTAGAFAAVAVQAFSSNLLLETLVGALAGAALAALLNWGLLRPFTKHTSQLVILVVVTAAASQLIQGAFGVAFGLNEVVLRTPVELASSYGIFLWTPLDVWIIVAAVVVMLTVHASLRYTSFGLSQRAVADNPTLAQIAGINNRRTVSATWLITGLLAGGAGVGLAATLGSFTNLIGFNFLLVTFAAAIIGGIGRVHGAMLGALIIGVATELAGYYLNSGYKEEFALLVLLVFLVFRPWGLLRAQASAGMA